jgi:hypothetical protein
MMDLNKAVALALQALQIAMQIITELKNQSGMTNDEILAHAQNVTAGNDELYRTLKATLAGLGVE